MSPKKTTLRSMAALALIRAIEKSSIRTKNFQATGFAAIVLSIMLCVSGASGISELRCLIAHPGSSVCRVLHA
jgi:hypothetical protein